MIVHGKNNTKKLYEFLSIDGISIKRIRIMKLRIKTKKLEFELDDPKNTVIKYTSDLVKILEKVLNDKETKK